MLMLLSPAKKLDYDSPVRTSLYTQPQFIDKAEKLINILRPMSEADLSSLMKLSPALAELNVQRNQQWQPEFTLNNSRQAVLAFNGDVYEGLEAAGLSDKQLKWAQKHMLILSGLYGVLRPLDLMQPYRLEMGTKLKNSAGTNLYQFWGSTIAEYINNHFEMQSVKNPIVLHLASEEYFKAVDKKVLKAKVVQCVFQDYKNGTWKVISFNAKKARGLMARYIIENQCVSPTELKKFKSAGYEFNQEESTESKLVFRRFAQ